MTGEVYLDRAGCSSAAPSSPPRHPRPQGGNVRSG